MDSATFIFAFPIISLSGSSRSVGLSKEKEKKQHPFRMLLESVQIDIFGYCEIVRIARRTAFDRCSLFFAFCSRCSNKDIEKR